MSNVPSAIIYAWHPDTLEFVEAVHEVRETGQCPMIALDVLVEELVKVLDLDAELAVLT